MKLNIQFTEHEQTGLGLRLKHWSEERLLLRRRGFQQLCLVFHDCMA